jgi:hypothetical protein
MDIIYEQQLKIATDTADKHLLIDTQNDNNYQSNYNDDYQSNYNDDYQSNYNDDYQSNQSNHNNNYQSGYSGGGLMQLVAYGAQDRYLTAAPQITFFKVVYRRHAAFGRENKLTQRSTNIKKHMNKNIITHKNAYRQRIR